ncbi:MAG: SMI1/KNR4 family protein, partial [Chloroflexota bacterium]
RIFYDEIFIELIHCFPSPKGTRVTINIQLCASIHECIMDIDCHSCTFRTRKTMYKLYKDFVIENPEDPPTHDEVKAIEKAVKAKLPEDFLEFLNVANGASLDGYYFVATLKPQPETINLSQILSTRKASRSFLSELEFQTRSQNAYQIPEKVLPIALCGGDVNLYLDLRTNGKSPVVAFIHGLPEWTGLQQHDTVTSIADNFSAFLNSLTFDSDFYKQHLQKMISQNEVRYIVATIKYLDLALPNWRDVFGFDYVIDSSQQ